MPFATLKQLRAAFQWDKRSLRYRGPSGAFVKASKLKAALVTFAERAGKEIQSLTRQMTTGEITVAEWQAATAFRLKNLHLANLAAASGGFEQLTQADYGRLGNRLRFHYAKLNQFAREVASGRLSTARILARANLYTAAGVTGYENARRDAAIAAGMTQERNVLGIAEHCALCLEQTARGWVDIGNLVPIGQRSCLMMCRCSYEFRRDDETPVEQPFEIVETPGDEAIRQAIGIDGSEAAELAGAQPNAKVRINIGTDGFVFVQIDGKGGSYYAERALRRGADGTLELHNDVLNVTDTGKGLGTRIFAQQVQAARAAGVKEIGTFGVRAEDANGYYTWPLIGYDGPIPAGVDLPANLASARTMSDLMSTKAGQQWWKENGVGLKLKFTVTPDASSRSEKVLNAYVKAKRRKAR